MRDTAPTLTFTVPDTFYADSTADYSLWSFSCPEGDLADGKGKGKGKDHSIGHPAQTANGNFKGKGKGKDRQTGQWYPVYPMQAGYDPRQMQMASQHWQLRMGGS